MRNFKTVLLLTAAIVIGAPPVLAISSDDEKQQYEAFFTRELSDGFTLYSEKRHMRVLRERRGNEAVTMYDELESAAGVQNAYDTVATDLWNPDDQVIDYAYRYDYADKRMHGPELFTAYFNTFVRPLMLKRATGPGPASKRFEVSLAQIGLPRLKGEAATIIVNKRYVDFEGRRLALVSFEIPAFSYTVMSGERLVHWASGAAITDEGGGLTYYLAVRHRAAAGAGKSAARPMYVEQSSYATDAGGRALLDLKRFAAGKALIDTTLKGETGRPNYHLNTPSDGQVAAVLDRGFFAAATGLTAIGLSVAEGSPNAPGGTAAAGAGGLQANANAAAQIGRTGSATSGINLPTRPGPRSPTAPVPVSSQPTPMSSPRSLPGPTASGNLGQSSTAAAPVQGPRPAWSLPGPDQVRPPVQQTTASPAPTRALPGPEPPRPGGLLPPGSSPGLGSPPSNVPEGISGRGPIQADTRVTGFGTSGQAAPPATVPPAGRTLPLPTAGDMPSAPQAPPPLPGARPPLPLPQAPKPGIVDAVKGAAGRAGQVLDDIARSTPGKILGGIGTAINGAATAYEIARALGIVPQTTTRDDFARLESQYVENGGRNLLLELGGIALSGRSPSATLLNALRVTLKSGNDISLAYFGRAEAERQAADALTDEMNTKTRYAKQLQQKINAGVAGARDQLAQLNQEIANLDRDIEAARERARQLGDKYRESIRKENAQSGGGEDEEVEIPQLPDGPGYPQVTKEQRDAIAKRAKERRERQAQAEAENEPDDARDFGDLGSEKIRRAILDAMLTEQILAGEARREKEHQDWKKFKDKSKDLTETFGDFIENNMFDFGGLTGRGLSGKVAVDLSPYGEWLIGQDINRLNALARAAGYPNLASALADSRNLIKKAQDQGFRQWAWDMPAFSGTIGIEFSQIQHELARAQLILGDLLNDSRFIESTAGLSDLAISGTTLSTIFRDFGLEDGDIIDITITQYGRPLLRQTLTLTNAGTAIQTNMRQGVGLIEIFAVNEGFASPNTAEITVNNVTGGNPVQQYSLNTGQTAILRVQTGK